MRVYCPVMWPWRMGNPKGERSPAGEGTPGSSSTGGSRGVPGRQSPALPWVCRRTALTEDPELVPSVMEISPVLHMTRSGLNPSVSVGVCEFLEPWCKWENRI